MNGKNHESSSIPAWAYETVEIQASSSQWEQRGLQEKIKLSNILSQFDVKEVEHIGSTAVPGLSAKPIIDMMVRVISFEKINEIIDTLVSNNWNYVPPELDGQDWRRFFVQVEKDKRVAHLQLIQVNEVRWEEQIKFRDKLRADPSLIKEYGEIKRKLAKEYRDDRERYTQGKSDFINRVLTD
ncbi:GrpB family protein [Exiguobacterium artemiae]|uniref:GrpB family protein n=1 Tax=Exiguobacterium artemiae TaxID=340145 RepID=UPI00296417E6|nr:GrpB family protein [Exiguobacterium sibiricum]MDW2886534.1 GrpB family protein [Exiguobacterium sibiricum]